MSQLPQGLTPIKSIKWTPRKVGKVSEHKSEIKKLKREAKGVNLKSFMKEVASNGNKFAQAWLNNKSVR